MSSDTKLTDKTKFKWSVATINKFGNKDLRKKKVLHCCRFVFFTPLVVEMARGLRKMLVVSLTRRQRQTWLDTSRLRRM